MSDVWWSDTSERSKQGNILMKLSVIPPNSSLAFNPALLSSLTQALCKLTTQPYRDHTDKLSIRLWTSQSQATDITLGKQQAQEWQIEHICQWHWLNTNTPKVQRLFDFNKRIFQALNTRRRSMLLLPFEKELHSEYEQWERAFLRTDIVDCHLRLLP